jgi:hypothetical protein
MRAARWLGVPPWELENQPAFWMEHALAFESAENWVDNERSRQEDRRRRRGR